MSLCRGLLAAAMVLVVGVACHNYHFEPKLAKGEIGIYDDLFSVSVQSDDHVVAVGYWGAIYVSNDGGKSWNQSDSGTKDLIYDVSMADETYGWAVGQLGMILRTEDGGRTWSHQDNLKVEQGVHLFSVQALDQKRAWVVGEWGTRLYTDNGGKAWKDFSLTIDETHPQFVWLSIADQERVRKGKKVFEDVGLNDVFCLPVDKKYCWMIGEFGYIFQTDNGGVSADGKASWKRAQIIGGIQVDPIALGHNVIEFEEKHRAPIRQLARQIADLQHLNIAIEPRVTEAEIQEFVKDGDPFPLFEIVEARTQEVQAIIEEAGILSDRIRRRGAPPWDYEDFIEDDPGFLTRWIDSRRSEVAGVEVEIAQNPYLFTIRFADRTSGFVSGLGGVVLVSDDGGATWRYSDVGRKQALFSVQPFRQKRAIVVGEKGFVRISKDGGNTWTPAPDGSMPTIFTFMRDVGFTTDERVGYIVGQRGMVMRSQDGGKTWKSVLPPDKRSS